MLKTGKKQFRTDSAPELRWSEIRLDIKQGDINKYLDPKTGYLTVPARIARADNIQTYFFNGKPVREFRPAEEVFREDTISSFNLKPVTVSHPSEMVNSGNIKNYQVGMTGSDTRRDGEFLATTIIINDKNAVTDIMRRHSLGKDIQLSGGYNLEVDETPGEHNGQRYDRVQRQIVGNHVGIVEAGNAGADVRLRIDTAQHKNENEGGSNMDFLLKLMEVGKNFRMDSLTVKIDQAAQAAMQAIQTRLDDLGNLAKKLLGENETLRTDNEKLSGDLSTSEVSLKERTDEVAILKEASSEERIALLVEERTDVLSACEGLEIKTEADDGKTRIDTLVLMRGVINKVVPEKFRVDEKLDASALRQRFVGCLASLETGKRTDQKGRYRSFVDGAEGADDEEGQTRKDYLAKQPGLHKLTASQILAGPGAKE